MTLTRAGILRAAGSTVAGVWLAGLPGCSPPPAPPPIVGEPTPGRKESGSALTVLAGLLDHEHALIAAYAAGFPLLTGTARAAARHFLGQELGHANELGSLIVRGGGRPAPFRADAHDLGRPRDAAGVLSLLHRLESAALGAYLDALPRLSPGHLRAELGAILANEAQHVSVLRRAAGATALPSPFVTAAE